MPIKILGSSEVSCYCLTSNYRPLITSSSGRFFQLHVSRDCPFNLCVPVVLLRPYGLSYARPWRSYNARDRHRCLCMQTAVAGAMTQTASLKLWQTVACSILDVSVMSSAGPLKYGPRPVFKVFWPVAILLYGPSQIVPCSSLPGPFREPPLILL